MRKKNNKQSIPLKKSSNKFHWKKAPDWQKKTSNFTHYLCKTSKPEVLADPNRSATKRTQTKCLFRSNQVLNNRKSQPSCTFTIERPFRMYFPTCQALWWTIRSPRHSRNEEKWAELVLRRHDAPPRASLSRRRAWRSVSGSLGRERRSRFPPYFLWWWVFMSGDFVVTGLNDIFFVCSFRRRLF